MTQQQLHTPIAPCDRPISALFGAGIVDEDNIISVLDDAIPLQDGASHATVLEYVVQIPLRYAECFALLSNGRKVGLQNPRKFVGWSRNDPNRSLLFHSNGEHFEVLVESGLRGQVPGCIRQVFLGAKSDRRPGVARKFIGVDGNLINLPDLAATS